MTERLFLYFFNQDKTSEYYLGSTTFTNSQLANLRSTTGQNVKYYCEWVFDTPENHNIKQTKREIKKKLNSLFGDPDNGWYKNKNKNNRNLEDLCKLNLESGVSMINVCSKSDKDVQQQNTIKDDSTEMKEKIKDLTKKMQELLGEMAELIK